MTTTALRPGDQFHTLGTLTIPTGDSYGAVVPRGQTVTITGEMIEATRDRTGASWLELVDDDEAQISKWGAVMFRRGECPEEVTWWNSPGDTAARGLARTQASEAAREISDPSERRAALAAADALYGPKQSTFTLGTYAPDAPDRYGPAKA